MTVPTCKEPKENMSHSSSWPDRAVTVKVRIDPVSRAYTIIPTFNEDSIRSSKSETVEPNLQQNVISVSTSKKKIDTRLSQVCENIPEGTVNEKPSDTSAPLTNDEADNGSDLTRGLRNFSPNDSSTSRRSNVGITSVSLEDYTFESIDRKNHLISRTLHLSLKSLGKNMSRSNNEIDDDSHLVKYTSSASKLFVQELTEFAKLNKKRAYRDKFHVAAEELSSGTSIPKRAINVSDVDKASHFVISTCNINTRESVKPPTIRIIDYDNVSPEFTNNLRSKHACPKCRSDGYLELQVDPFRPAHDHRQIGKQQKTKNNCVETGTFPDRRFRSRSTTYDFRHDLEKSFGRRTKSFAGNLRDGVDANESPSRPRPAIDHKKEMTLRRHYYPEGGWGYVVVTCSALVHFLGIGLQLAAPGSWHVSAERKFHHPALHSAGELIRQIFCVRKIY